jgi:hypothetical protein
MKKILIAIALSLTAFVASDRKHKEFCPVAVQEHCDRLAEEADCDWDGFKCNCPPEFMDAYPCDTKKEVLYLSDVDECNRVGKSYDFPKKGSEKLCCIRID